MKKKNPVLTPPPVKGTWIKRVKKMPKPPQLLKKKGK